MFVVKFNFEWITLAVKKISEITKNPIWVMEEQNMQTLIFTSHICINSCSEMKIGETCSISLMESLLHKKKQIINIFS